MLSFFREFATSYTIISEYISSQWRDNKKLFFWMGIVLLLSYGFKLTHVTYNNDVPYSLDSDFVTLLYQGRWGHSLFSCFGFLDRMTPFWNDFVGLLILSMASLIWAKVWAVASYDKLSSKALTVFVLIFISNPLQLEYGVFPAGFTGMSIGFILVGFAMILLQRKSRSAMIGSAILVMTATAIYESFLIVYLTSLVLIFLLDILYNNRQDSFKTLFVDIRKISIAVVLSTVLYSLSQYVLDLFYTLPAVTGAAKGIPWLEGVPVISVIKETLLRLVYHYGYNAFFYFPILLLIIIIPLSVILLPVRMYCKSKKVLVLVLVLGSILASFSLHILQGGLTSYRTSQALMLFIPFLTMLLITSQKYVKLWMMFAIIIIFFQTKEATLISVADWEASKNSEFKINRLVHDIREEHGVYPKKAVVLLGHHMFNQLNRNVGLLDVSFTKSIPFFRRCGAWNIGLTQMADTEPSRLRIKHLTGLDCQTLYGDERERLLVSPTFLSMPSFPEKNYIRETDDYILVKLGNQLPNDVENIIINTSLQNEIINYWKSFFNRK